MGELQLHDFDGPARCSGCGALAAGPCARCETPLCGDCAGIVGGGSRPDAICHPCQRRVGSDLTRPWLQVLGWWVFPVVLLAAALAVLGLLFGA